MRHEVDQQEFGDRLIYSSFERDEVLADDRIMIETWRAWADEQLVRDRKYSRFLLKCSPHSGG